MTNILKMIFKNQAYIYTFEREFMKKFVEKMHNIRNKKKP